MLMTQLIYWVSCCHPKSQNHLSLQKDGSFEKTFTLRRNINQRPLSSKTVVGLDAYIKRLDQQLRKRYAEKRELDDDISSLVKEPQTHIGRLQKQRYYTLKELRWRRCDLWSKINMLKNRIKQRKNEKYSILYPKVKEKTMYNNMQYRCI
jgi:hypothetical protein